MSRVVGAYSKVVQLVEEYRMYGSYKRGFEVCRLAAQQLHRIQKRQNRPPRPCRFQSPLAAATAPRPTLQRRPARSRRLANQATAAAAVAAFSSESAPVGGRSRRTTTARTRRQRSRRARGTRSRLQTRHRSARALACPAAAGCVKKDLILLFLPPLPPAVPVRAPTYIKWMTGIY